MKMKNLTQIALCVVYLTWASLANAIELYSDKKTYNAGESIRISYVGVGSLSESAWVGIIPSNIEHGSESINDAHDINYAYIPKGASGEVTLQLPSKPGNYDLRISDAGKELVSYSFSVQAIDSSKLSMMLSEQSVRPGTELKITLVAETSLSSEAWLGLVPSSVEHGDGNIIDQHDITYVYLGENPNQTYTLTVPEKSGNYDIRLVSTNKNGRELLSKSFLVSSIDSSNVRLTLEKNEFSAGEQITVTFAGTKEFSEKAWIGIIPSKVPHGDAKTNDQHDIDYRYLSGKSEGKFVFIAPSKKGQFDFRLHDTEFGNEVRHVSFEVENDIDAQSIKNTLDLKGRVSLYGIYFDLDKATLKDSSFPLLEQLTLMLKQNNQLAISIEGHTDSQGDQAYNQKLSENRATAVMNYLIEKGIKRAQLKAVGFGEESPVESNESPLGRALNRRVDIVKLVE